MKLCLQTQKWTKLYVLEVSKTYFPLPVISSLHFIYHFVSIFHFYVSHSQNVLPTYPPNLVEYFLYRQRACKMIVDASATFLKKKFKIPIFTSSRTASNHRILSLYGIKMNRRFVFEHENEQNYMRRKFLKMKIIKSEWSFVCKHKNEQNYTSWKFQNRIFLYR